MSSGGFQGFGVVLVIFFILFIIFVLKCCIDTRKPTVKRRPHPVPIQYYYEDYSENSQPVRATAPPTHNQISTYDNVDGDDIVVIPHPNEASPVVVPPYPVEPRHPTPHAAPPGPGFATHNPPYPTHPPHPVPGAAPYSSAVTPTPYPPASTTTPYPPASNITPYPPAGPPMGGSAPYPEYGAQPPSYSEAVLQPPVQPLPSKDVYNKQAPYNPNY